MPSTTCFAKWIWVLALFGLCNPGASAGSAPDSEWRVIFTEENPNFNFDGRDRHYTNGAQVALLTPRLAEANCTDTPISLAGTEYSFVR